MAKYSVLIEARPFCASDTAALQKLKDSGMGMIDLRGSGVESSEFIDALKQADAILCGNGAGNTSKSWDLKSGKKPLHALNPEVFKEQ